MPSAIELARGDEKLIAAIRRSRRLIGRKALMAAAASAVPLPGIDWAADAGLTLWQTLPLGPTSFGESPYGALSSFAGNPLLISPERPHGAWRAVRIEPRGPPGPRTLGMVRRPTMRPWYRPSGDRCIARYRLCTRSTLERVPRILIRGCGRPGACSIVMI